jgi:hypothetical protein
VRTKISIDHLEQIMKHASNHGIRLATAVILWCTLAAAAEASTVAFTQSSIDVVPGETFTVDLVGSDFSAGPDGAAFALSWDPAVLSYVSTAVANPPWDTSYVSDGTASAGNIEYIFLNKSVGNAGSAFALASFTFNVLGNPGDATSLMLSNDPYNTGFVAPGAVPIAVNYVNSQVHVVPVPAALWLFGSALAGMGFLRRRITD